MAFSKRAFSTEERVQLQERIKRLEEEIARLKLGNQPKEEAPTNSLEDMLC